MNGIQPNFAQGKIALTTTVNVHEILETFLFQRISVLLQRDNSILLHDSFIREKCHSYNFLY